MSDIEIPNDDRFGYAPRMTRDEFIAANPFGTVKIQVGVEEPRDMTPEEYEQWVDQSKGIWG